LALLTDGAARRRQLDALARLAATMVLPDGERPSDKAAAIVVAAAETWQGRRRAALQRFA
jgi:hypothetical protein